MQKLIELLNEYEKEHNTGLHWRIDEMYWMLWRWLNLMWVDQYLISKHYWFIKWLVENERIDLYAFSTIDWFDDYESLLMLLSIQDEPISFLCEILK